MRGVGLAADNARLREELDRLRDGGQTLLADLARGRQARREAEAGRERTLKALKAERNAHGRTRRRLRNARAAAARLQASRDAVHRQPDGSARTLQTTRGAYTRSCRE